MFKENNYCLRKRDLAISGNDLIDIGYEQNATLGKALNYLFEKVLETPSLNNKDSLRGLAANFLKTVKDDVSMNDYEFVIILDDENTEDGVLPEKEN